ncbi:MAG: ParB/RepB/Spo0J family partition protein [Patescibacteria group bacterium]
MNTYYDGLGRGLDSLIPKKRSEAAKMGISDTILGPQEELTYIDPLLVEANPHQPRKTFEHAAIEELVDSIEKHGILQPLVVTKYAKGYQLISGERRLRASLILELKKVPVIVREASEQQKLELALIENVQRKDLNPIERAWGYARLIEEFGLTQEEAAKKVSQSRASVANALRLLKLSDMIQKAIIDGIITEGHAKVIAGVETPEAQERLFERMISGKFTVRDAEQAVRESRPQQKKKVQKNIDQDDLAERLQAALGTKVSISRKGSRGTVAIHFFSEEEYQSIIKRLLHGS